MMKVDLSKREITVFSQVFFIIISGQALSYCGRAIQEREGVCRGTENSQRCKYSTFTFSRSSTVCWVSVRSASCVFYVLVNLVFVFSVTISSSYVIKTLPLLWSLVMCRFRVCQVESERMRYIFLFLNEEIICMLPYNELTCVHIQLWNSLIALFRKLDGESHVDIELA